MKSGGINFNEMTVGVWFPGELGWKDRIHFPRERDKPKAAEERDEYQP
jgi:hypothetical protein